MSTPEKEEAVVLPAVEDVAEYLLEKHGGMSAMKLQKLIYYVQAWSLARRKRRFFEEDIEAWTYGPVVYRLFDLHRGQYVVLSLNSGNPERLSADDRAFIDETLRGYLPLSAAQLVQRTHAEAPWRLAREGRGPRSARGSPIIQDELMANFYANQPSSMP